MEPFFFFFPEFINLLLSFLNLLKVILSFDCPKGHWQILTILEDIESINSLWRHWQWHNNLRGSVKPFIIYRKKKFICSFQTTFLVTTNLCLEKKKKIYMPCLHHIWTYYYVKNLLYPPKAWVFHFFFF